MSAHRTPHWLAEYAGGAKERGLQVIIAGAGGAAHLPGMAAAFTTLPVLGVPVESKALQGLDSLLSIAQMPAGVPVGTLAIGEPGAKNAALLAISILALQDMGDATDGRSKGLAHGEQLLDILDSVRDGLLAGGIPRATLNRLAVAVTRRHDVFADPKLQDVLDQIELRAHVELAKLEQLDKRIA